MVYGDTDLAAAEREAWQRGDQERADILGLLLDSQEAEQETENAVSEAEDKYTRAQEAWGEHNASMRELLAELRSMLELAARVSDRQDMLDKLTEADELIDKADGS